MANISKAEHIRLKCDAAYWQTQFKHPLVHRDRDVQRLKDEMARRDQRFVQLVSQLKDAMAQREAQCISLKGDAPYWRMQCARASGQRDPNVQRFKEQMAQRCQRRCQRHNLAHRAEPAPSAAITDKHRDIPPAQNITVQWPYGRAG